MTKGELANENKKAKGLNIEVGKDEVLIEVKELLFRERERKVETQ